MKIDFFTFLGPNSAEYAEFLKYTCEKFLSGCHEINWRCIDSVGCDRIPQGYKLVDKSIDVGHPSMNHAAAITLAQQYIESEYVIFADCDIAILYKNWDHVIINELNKVDFFGGTFGMTKKYKNFPSVYFFSFRSYILDRIKLDFYPKLQRNAARFAKYKLSEDECYYLKMRNGSVIRCDTGWSIPFQIRKTGFTFDIMESVNMYSKKSQMSFEDEKHKDLCMKHPGHMSEWHYKGKLFASHRHASYGFSMKSILGDAWKRKVDLYIKSYKEEIS
ncbi:MAG: hypothetical protein ACFFDI_28625 [Promethearchaeota archaeon]